MSYMVMECHPAFVVVMDEEGRFIKAANRGYQVGQTIGEILPMQLPDTPAPAKGRKAIPGPWLRTFAAAAACLVLAVLVLFPRGPVAYASVYLTINPQVRIDVDRADAVVSLSAQNPDGTRLLEGYQYQNKPLEQVVSELIDKAVEMHFLQSGGRVILSLDAADPQWVTQHQADLQKTLDAHLSAQLDTDAIRVETIVRDDDDDADDDDDDADDAEDTDEDSDEDAHDRADADKEEPDDPDDADTPDDTDDADDVDDADDAADDVPEQ